VTEILWVCAAPREREGAPELPGRAVELGVGKTSAAMHLMSALGQARPELVVGFGVAGAYRGGGLEVGDVCVVVEELLADEGVMTPQGFLSIDALALGDSGPFRASAPHSRRIAAALGVREVKGATVSTCSGTDAASSELYGRTHAAVETMEGAVIGRVCAELRIPWVQLRAISNRTGDRDEAGWDLDAAIDRLHEALGKLVADPSLLAV
jgi:futalosine hydrolase